MKNSHPDPDRGKAKDTHKSKSKQQCIDRDSISFRLLIIPHISFIHIYICHPNIPFILKTLVGVFTAHLRFTNLICNWCKCILHWNQIDIKLDIWIDRNVQKFVSRHNKRTEPGTNNECMILESHNCLTHEIAKIKFFKRFKMLLILLMFVL